MLSTHPSTPERISLALQAARRVGAPGLGEADRAGYLGALDGVAYGDDPADGVVRGRHFIHPRLGVAFEGPEGLTLENTSRAVVGSSVDGNRRLLFDAIATEDGQSLESVLQSTWNDALETGSIETLTVNGRPAAIAVLRNKDWAFRLAAISVGETTYRVVLAMRPSSPDLEPAFRQMLDSVRGVTAEEARALRPLHLRIVTARDSDTIETVASHMGGVDRPIERFMVLNGLRRGDPLGAGGSYKIVVE
jgi:predicted Zn-dependent protease